MALHGGNKKHISHVNKIKEDAGEKPEIHFSQGEHMHARAGMLTRCHPISTRQVLRSGAAQGQLCHGKWDGQGGRGGEKKAKHKKCEMSA